MRTLDAGQALLAQRQAVSCVPLVVLETYTDRDARTVDETFYWTRGYPLKYEWDGVTAVHFQPRISTVRPLIRGFEHIPNAAVFSNRDEAIIQLDGSPQAGTYLWSELRAANIIGARVTIASLLVDLSGALDDPRYFDLEPLGAVHEVRWRGEVTALPEFYEEALTFDLVCESEEPPVSWPLVASGSGVSEEAVGWRWPMPVGSNVGLIGVPINLGALGILDGNHTSVVTTISLLDASAFTFESPNTIGYAIIDDEIVTYTGVSGNDLTGVTRAAGAPSGTPSSTTNVSHDGGALVSQMLAFYRIGVSGQTASGINFFGVVGAQGTLVSSQSSGTLLNSVDETGVLRSYYEFSDQEFRNLFFQHRLATELATPAGKTLYARIDGLYDDDGSPTTVQDCAGDESNWTGATVTASAGSLGIKFSSTAHSARALASFSETFVELRFTLTWESAADATEPVLLIASLWDTSVRQWIDLVDLSDINRNSSTVMRFLIASSGDTIDFDEIRLQFIGSLSATYKPVINGLITVQPVAFLGDHALDVVQWLINTYMPLPAGTIDTTSFATAETNTPDLAWAGDLSWRGGPLAETLASMGYECRTNFVWSDDNATQTKLKAFNSDEDGDFSASVRTLTDYRNLRAEVRQLPEIANDFKAYYSPTGAGDPSSLENYTESIVARSGSNGFDPRVSDADIDSSTDLYGSREAAPFALTLVGDAAVAKDVAGYYADDALSADRLRLSFVLPWWEGYDVEPGDIVEINPDWSSSAIKCRIIKTVFDFDANGVGVNAEEVS